MLSLAAEFVRGGDGFTHILALETSALLWALKKIFFIMAVAVIWMCCMGSAAESIICPIVLIAAAEFLPLLLYRLITDNFADVSVVIPDVYLYWKYDFPLYGCAPLSEKNISAAVQCIFWLIVIAGGVFLYGKHKAEETDKSVAFKVFFEFSTAILLLFFFTAASIENRLKAAEILAAFIGSIILRLTVWKKTFKLNKILFMTVAYASYYLVFLLLMFAAFKTGGFGILYREADRAEFDEYMILSAEITSVDEDSYSYGSTVSESYYSIQKFIEYGYSANTENTEKFLEYTVNAEKAQGTENGVFLWKMFGSSFGAELYQCRITIITSPEKQGFYPMVYFRNFYFSRDDADEFIRGLESLEFTETEIDHLVSVD